MSLISPFSRQYVGGGAHRAHGGPAATEPRHAPLHPRSQVVVSLCRPIPLAALLSSEHRSRRVSAHSVKTATPTLYGDTPRLCKRIFIMKNKPQTNSPPSPVSAAQRATGLFSCLNLLFVSRVTPLYFHSRHLPGLHSYGAWHRVTPSPALVVSRFGFPRVDLAISLFLNLFFFCFRAPHRAAVL